MGMTRAVCLCSGRQDREQVHLLLAYIHAATESCMQILSCRDITASPIHGNPQTHRCVCDHNSEHAQCYAWIGQPNKRSHYVRYSLCLSEARTWYLNFWCSGSWGDQTMHQNGAVWLILFSSHIGFLGNPSLIWYSGYFSYEVFPCMDFNIGQDCDYHLYIHI